MLTHSHPSSPAPFLRTSLPACLSPSLTMFISSQLNSVMWSQSKQGHFNSLICFFTLWYLNLKTPTCLACLNKWFTGTLTSIECNFLRQKQEAPVWYSSPAWQWAVHLRHQEKCLSWRNSLWLLVDIGAFLYRIMLLLITLLRLYDTISGHM